MDSIFPDLDTFSQPTTIWSELDKRNELLYTAYILPDYSYLEGKFGTEKADKITYRIIDGGETWITVGKPIFIPMEKILEEIKIAPSFEIKAQMDDYKFGYLKIAAGFGGHVGSPHPMIEGRVTVSLSAESDTREPINYAWSPHDVSTEEKVTKEYSITPSFDFVPIAGTQLHMQGGYKKHIEFTQLSPFVSVVGGQTSKLTWIHKKTPSLEQIEGGREGRIISRLDKNSRSLKVKIEVTVKVKENFKKWVSQLSGKWNENDFHGMAEEEFLLSRGLKMTYDELHNKRFSSDFADNILNKPLNEEDKEVRFNIKTDF